MAAAALAVALLALAQAAPAQGEDPASVDDRLAELSAHVEESNRVNTTLYIVSFAIGVGLAGIAIYATCKNTSNLNRQLENYEERTRLLREDIDEGLTPMLAWTAAERGGGDGAGNVNVMGGRLMAVRIVNAGRASAMRVTGHIGQMLSRDGIKFEEAESKHDSWGAVLPDDSILVRVWVSDKTLEAAGKGGAFRVDILLEYRSVNGSEYSLRMTARHDRGRLVVRDVLG